MFFFIFKFFVSFADSQDCSDDEVSDPGDSKECRREPEAVGSELLGADDAEDSSRDEREKDGCEEHELPSEPLVSGEDLTDLKSEVGDDPGQVRRADDERPIRRRHRVLQPRRTRCEHRTSNQRLINEERGETQQTRFDEDRESVPSSDVQGGGTDDHSRADRAEDERDDKSRDELRVDHVSATDIRTPSRDRSGQVCDGWCAQRDDEGVDVSRDPSEAKPSQEDDRELKSVLFERWHGWARFYFFFLG